MHMRTAEPGRHLTEGCESDRLVVFAFFMAGAAAMYFLGLPVSALPAPRIVLTGLLGAVLLLSLSALGGVLLPVCALAFGALSQQTALAALPLSPEYGALDLRLIASSFLLVPVFFLASVHGMKVSAYFQTALQHGGPTVKTAFQRELAVLAFLTLFGCAAVFYFY